MDNNIGAVAIAVVSRSKAVIMVVVEVATVMSIAEVIAYVGRHKGMEEDSSNNNN